MPEWKPIGTRRRPSLLFSQQDMRDSFRHARTGWTGVVSASGERPQSSRHIYFRAESDQTHSGPCGTATIQPA